MDAQRLTVRFYRSANGREPVREWLLSLDRNARRSIGAEIKTVQLGWPMGMPLVRKLQRSLWEVRVRLTDVVARVVFTVVGSDMVLLHGFIKKTQQTPKDDLAVAVARRSEVERGG